MADIMAYSEAREYIDGVAKSGIKLGLDRMRELMGELGNPQDKLKIIHVAGTNGKGSTCNFISVALSANGYRTGMYTSPAVEDKLEQYCIDGNWISEEDYAQVVSDVKAAVERMIEKHSAASINGSKQNGVTADIEYEPPTCFEQETAMAFLYFYKKGCDFAVIETGMGGLEDATNVIKTTCIAVLTSIAEDHLGMIGNSLTEIAATKAGIIKNNISVVIAPNPPEVTDVVIQRCRETNSRLINNNIRRKFDLKLEGAYQQDNATLAVNVIEELARITPDISIDLNKSIEAISNANWPFRMEKIMDEPLFYLDGAHNPNAANRLAETIRNDFSDYKFIYIMGMFKDKDYEEVVRIMLPFAEHILTVETPTNPRALHADELAEVIRGQCLTESKDIIVDTCATIEEAVKQSLKMANAINEDGNKCCVLAFGSLSYLGYVRSVLDD